MVSPYSRGSLKLQLYEIHIVYELYDHNQSTFAHTFVGVPQVFYLMVSVSRLTFDLHSIITKAKYIIICLQIKT